MNIQNRLNKELFKLGVAATAGVLIGMATPKVVKGYELAYNDVKEKIEAVKDRVETEKAIRAEGIQAQSYAEAKMKLDSVRFKRLCDELNVPVPQKPAETGDQLRDCSEMLNYHAKVQDVYSKAIENNLKQFGEIIQERIK